ncbi:cytochrome P450 [Abortiporus biennis]|nr:cytochrome P450 [Abortiporus biennis]
MSIILEDGYQTVFTLFLVLVLVRVARTLFSKDPIDNIPGPHPTSFIGGNLPQFFDRQGWAFQRELGEKYGAVVKLTTLLGGKWLYVFDPRALNEIVVKNQDVYEETPIFLTGNRLIFGPGLMSTVGEHHRRQRKMLNPAFSTSELRELLPIFRSVTARLHKGLKARLQNTSQEVDVLDWTTRTALEIIGQGGLGYSFDPLVEERPDPAAEAVKALEPTLFPMYILRVFMPHIVKIGSPKFRRTILEWTPYPRLQRLKDITDTLENTVTRILQQKKTALAAGEKAVTQQVGEGKDILSILLKANMDVPEADQVPESELLGHMSTFIFAAMSTTSHATSCILHQLAIHENAQIRLRKEIKAEIFKSITGELSYDELMNLPYLDAVCRETLRLYPPVPFIGRRTQKPTVMPLATPIKGLDGSSITSIPIPEQSTVIIAIQSANTNKAIWGEDALEWKPDRWLKPLPQPVLDAGIPGIYSHIMTFLGGGRACIGYKFAELEMKLMLCTLLTTFSFALCPDKEIFWNIAGIRYPTVGQESTKAEMPLRVSLVKHKKTNS